MKKVVKIVAAILRNTYFRPPKMQESPFLITKKCTYFGKILL